MYRTTLMSSVTFSFCAHPVLCFALTIGLVSTILLCMSASMLDGTPSKNNHNDNAQANHCGTVNTEDMLSPQGDRDNTDTSSCAEYFSCRDEESHRDSSGLSTRNYQVLELCLECFSLVPNPILRVLKRVYQTKRQGTLTFAVLYQRDRLPASGHRQCPSSSSSSSSNSNTPNNNIWKQIGRTEIVSHCNRDCRFVTKFNWCCGTTEKRNRPLRVEVYQYLRQRSDLRAGNMIGATEFSADDILSDHLFRKNLTLNSSRARNTGCLRVSGNPIRLPSPGVNVKKILLDVALSPSTTKGVHAAFYVLCRELPSGDYTAVYRSEVIGRGTERFEWMIKDVDAVTGGGADDTQLRLELYQLSGKGKPTQLGFVQMSVEKLGVTAIGQPLTWRAHNRLGLIDRCVRGGWWGMRQMDVEQVVLVKKSVDMVRSKYALNVR